jgi:DNA primase
VPSDSLRAFLERASKLYHSQLDPAVSEYLTGPERGLNDETITKFRLGAVVDPLPGHEQYRGCLAIPYLTPSGSVTSIRFRNLTGRGAKYLTVAGDKPRLYNTAALELNTRAMCVTEGELDADTADMCGLPVVGAPGADSWLPVWGRLLTQYDVVYTLSDDDEAGQKFAYAVAKTTDNVRNVVMTGGDVTTFALEHGAEELCGKVGKR